MRRGQSCQTDTAQVEYSSPSFFLPLFTSHITTSDVEIATQHSIPRLPYQQYIQGCPFTITMSLVLNRNMHDRDWPSILGQVPVPAFLMLPIMFIFSTLDGDGFLGNGIFQRMYVAHLKPRQKQVLHSNIRLPASRSLGSWPEFSALTKSTSMSMYNNNIRTE